MAKYYDEPRRDTSTSTLTDETPKYQKAAQRKKVAKGCPALDGDAHIYGATKIITKDRENDTVKIEDIRNIAAVLVTFWTFIVVGFVALYFNTNLLDWMK